MSKSNILCSREQKITKHMESIPGLLAGMSQGGLRGFNTGCYLLIAPG